MHVRCPQDQGLQGESQRRGKLPARSVARSSRSAVRAVDPLARKLRPLRVEKRPIDAAPASRGSRGADADRPQPWLPGGACPPSTAGPGAVALEESGPLVQDLAERLQERPHRLACRAAAPQRLSRRVIRPRAPPHPPAGGRGTAEGCELTAKRHQGRAQRSTLQLARGIEVAQPRGEIDIDVAPPLPGQPHRGESGATFRDGRVVWSVEDRPRRVDVGRQLRAVRPIMARRWPRCTRAPRGVRSPAIPEGTSRRRCSDRCAA